MYKINSERLEVLITNSSEGYSRLIYEVASAVMESGKLNSIQREFLKDNGLLEESDNTDLHVIRGGRENEEVKEVKSTRKVLGVYDFIDNEKDTASKRRAFWLLIHQVHQEISKEIGDSKAPMDIIVPLHFIPILNESVAFISAEDERIGGVEEFNDIKISYEGRLQGSDYSIYSSDRGDSIYLVLKDGRHALIKVK